MSSLLLDILNSSSSSFASSSSGSLNGSDSSNNTSIKYRSENYIPPYVAGIVIAACAVVFTIAFLIAFFNCCRGKKLIETDEDEARLMADEYFDPDDASTYSQSGASVEEAAGEFDNNSDDEDEVFAAPQPVARGKTAKNAKQHRSAPPAKSRSAAPPARKRKGKKAASDSVSNDSKPGYYATYGRGSNGSHTESLSSSDSDDDSDVYDDEAMEDFYSHNSSSASRRRR